jgi:uncharacterized membrane protein YhaH (DUF805 family)
MSALVLIKVTISQMKNILIGFLGIDLPQEMSRQAPGAFQLALQLFNFFSLGLSGPLLLLQFSALDFKRPLHHTLRSRLIVLLCLIPFFDLT